MLRTGPRFGHNLSCGEFTGTAAEVTPVSEIGPYKFTAGEVCRTLIADFTVAVNPQKAAAE
jgi:branched-chain amino acid aminotransferase